MASHGGLHQLGLLLHYWNPSRLPSRLQSKTGGAGEFFSPWNFSYQELLTNQVSELNHCNGFCECRDFGGA